MGGEGKAANAESLPVGRLHPEEEERNRKRGNDATEKREMIFDGRETNKRWIGRLRMPNQRQTAVEQSRGIQRKILAFMPELVQGERRPNGFPGLPWTARKVLLPSSYRSGTVLTW